MRTSQTLSALAGLMLTTSAWAQLPCEPYPANFQWTPQDLNLVLLTPDAIASSPNVSYHWSFGDGTFSTEQMPIHLYAPGQYNACLTVITWDPITQDSCSSLYCTIVAVDDFIIDPCEGLNADFQTNTQGQVAQFYSSNMPFATYYWSFGDGTTAYGPSPTHTYAQPGQYNACLAVSVYDPNTQATCTADHCGSVNIAGQPCEPYPANFQWTPQDLNLVLLTPDAIASSPNVSYHWSFGDGTFSTEQMPIHLYAPGQYNACLTVITWDPITQDSCSSLYCTIVAVDDFIIDPCEGLNAGFQVTTNGPVASFLSGAAQGVNYHWNFGDGSSGLGPNPTHTYAQPGQYNACLKVWAYDPNTQDTCWADHCEWITINSGGSPCDSSWAPSYDWTAGNAVIELWSTTNTGNWDNTMVWTADGTVIGTGPQVSFHPNTSSTVSVCLQVSLYDDPQQLVCSGTSCDSVGLSITTGIDEAAENDGVAVYPQPFSDRLTVNAEGLTGPVRALLLDMSGRIVDDRRVTLSGPTQLDYSGLPAGTYVLRLQGASADRVVRVLKR